MLEQKIESILISEEQIRKRTAELGAAITKDYAGKEILLVSILKGAVVFMTDLMRQIDLPLAIDFMCVSSYGDGTVSSGSVKILKDLDTDISGKEVLIVEDIFDSGVTLSRVVNILSHRNPASIRICTLLEKPTGHKVDLKMDYSGFDVPDAFVVGYGLDYAGLYRNLPYIGVLKPEVYRK